MNTQYYTIKNNVIEIIIQLPDDNSIAKDSGIILWQDSAYNLNMSLTRYKIIGYMIFPAIIIIIDLIPSNGWINLINV